MDSCQTEAEAYQQNQEPESLDQPEAFQEEWEPESSSEEGADAYEENQENPGQQEAYQAPEESSMEEDPQVI